MVIKQSRTSRRGFILGGTGFAAAASSIGLEASSSEKKARRTRLTPIDGGNLKDEVGLCLSGGGYRAMLFHVGAIYRINELGLLKKIDRISSVSGGSYTAATLAACWSALKFDSENRAINLDEIFWLPQRALANNSIDIPAVVGGLLPFNSAARQTIMSFEQHLTRGLKLSDLPKRPQFIFNSTNLITGSNFSFYRDHLSDWRVGEITEVDFSLAEAVAASGAFTPFLSPYEIDFSGGRVKPYRISHLSGAARQSAKLTDGGIYDNLGTEPIWKDCKTVFVSNGGHPFSEDFYPGNDWISQVARMAGILMNDCEALRKRILQHAYEVGSRQGTIWSLNSGEHDLQERPVEMLSDDEFHHAQKISTRMTRFSDEDQNLLIKAGYAHAAHKLKRHYGPEHGGPPYRPLAMSYPRV